MFIVFFISSLGKFVVGGYVAIIISLMVLFIMIAWYRGTEIEQEQNIFLNMREHLDSIKKLQNDESIPLCSNNVVYLVKGDETEVIDSGQRSETGRCLLVYQRQYDE